MTQLQRNTFKPVSTTDPDADLLEKVAQHDEIWELCAGDYIAAGFVDQMCSLEIEIASSPAHTARGLAGKLRVIERAEFCPAVQQYVDESLRQDRRRIG